MLTLSLCLLVASAAPPAPEQAVIDLVTSSQQAGIVGGDTAAYLKAFAPDARWIAGRGPDPGPHDTTIGYAQGKGRAELRGHSKTPGLTLRHENPQVTFSDGGRTATLTVRTVAERGRYLEQTGERYTLRKTPAGWRIVENRYWPEMSRFGADVTLYGKGTWKELDAAVDEARGSGARHVMALLSAWRFGEAQKVARQATADGQASGSLWALRAQAEYLNGDVAAAKEAVRKARKADPKAYLPPWAEGL